MRGPYWRLPVSVTEEVSGVFIVVPAEIPMLAMQHVALSAVLDAISFSRSPNQWRLMGDALNRVASPWDHSAEMAVVWNPPEILKTPRKTRRSEHWIEMRAGLVRDGWFEGEVEAELAMHIIFEAMMSRLVNDRKPVDLGFCTLLPSPRATDFTEQVDTWCRASRLPIERSAEWRPEIALKMYQHLCGQELTAVTQFNERIIWQVIALPGKSWWEWTARRESRILQKLGEDAYKHYVSECLKATLPDAVKVLDATRKKKSYAPPRRAPSRFLVRPVRPKPATRPAAHNPGSKMGRPPIDDEGKRALNAIADLARENAAVPGVSDLRPEDPDVWLPSREDLDKS